MNLPEIAAKVERIKTTADGLWLLLILDPKTNRWQVFFG